MFIVNVIRKFIKHPGFRKYFANSSWLFAGRLFNMVVGLIVGVWVARYLGPARFGLLSFARSFVGLFVIVSTLGLDQIVIRELVKDKSKRDVLLGTSFVLKLLGAILAIGVIFVTMQFYHGDNTANLLVMIIAISLVFQTLNVVDFYFQANVVSKFSVIANVFSVILSSFVKIGLILYKAELKYFAMLAVFDAFTLTCGYLYFYVKHRNLSVIRWRFDKNCARSLLKDSWPLILSGIAIGVYMKIDKVMVKMMIDNNAVGQYAAAVKLCEVWYFMSFIFVDSVFPALISAKKVNEVLYYSRVSLLYGIMFYVGFVISIFTFFASKYIVFFIYGSEYYMAVSIINLYIWVIIFSYWGVINKFVLVIENLQKYRLVALVVGAFVDIVANYFFIKMYGVIGAVFSTLLAQIVSTFLIYFVWKKTRKIPFIALSSPVRFFKLLIEFK